MNQLFIIAKDADRLNHRNLTAETQFMSTKPEK